MTKTTSDKIYYGYAANHTHDRCKEKLPLERLILDYFDDGYTPSEISRLLKLRLDTVRGIVVEAVVRA